MEKAFRREYLRDFEDGSAADVNAPGVTRAIGELERSAIASGHFNRPMTVDVAPSGKVAVVTMPIAGDGTDARSNAALAGLRDELIPATIGKAGAQAQVTGATA